MTKLFLLVVVEDDVLILVVVVVVEDNEAEILILSLHSPLFRSKYCNVKH
jgi:hypothetical protein